MIALIRSGFFEELSGQAVGLWSILFLVGWVLCRLIRPKRVRLIAACVSLALLGLADLMVLLPTPALFPGDGYALWGDMGLIGASFLAPMAAGLCLRLLITAIVRRPNEYSRAAKKEGRRP